MSITVGEKAANFSNRSRTQQPVGSVPPNAWQIRVGPSKCLTCKACETLTKCSNARRRWVICLMVGSMSLLILFIILGTYRTRMVNPTPRNTTGADLYTGLAPTSLPDNDSTTQATVHPATGSASIDMSTNAITTESPNEQLSGTKQTSQASSSARNDNSTLSSGMFSEPAPFSTTKMEVDTFDTSTSSEVDPATTTVVAAAAAASTQNAEGSVLNETGSSDLVKETSSGSESESSGSTESAVAGFTTSSNTAFTSIASDEPVLMVSIASTLSSPPSSASNTIDG
ncbi:mucin-21-like isoform X1 [Varroa jacobsoni]|uniref:mucin-21-like isoform X1 n=2 Tax=Varroa jacobsoni TaxID=62625 RepID=UPI000BF9E108|nr:mucin-21-like isoform X1 [Varroa jacobsoni]